MNAASDASTYGAALLAIETRRRSADGAIRLFWDEDGALPEVDPARFDVLLTPAPAPRPWVQAPSLDDVLGSVYRAVTATPLATCTLLTALREAESRSFDDALEIESRAYSSLLFGPEFRAWRRRTPALPPRQPVAQPVRCTRDGDAVTLHLADPARLNAFSTAMRDALADALDNCLADPTLATVTLRGDGRGFCSGGALDEFGLARDPDAAHRIRLAQSAALRLRRLGVRARAVVHGTAVGSGIEIAAAAARVVATQDACFRLPELCMGLITGAGGIATIAPRIGRQRMAWMMLTGTRLTALRALEWGLVDELVTGDGPST
jgi:enoyl-CoA hydratase/carnithine racemase